MRLFSIAGASLVLLLTLSSCSSTPDKSAEVKVIPEIRPGVLQGYLPMDDPIASVEFVPPAPAANSPRQAMDDAVAERMFALRDTPRWELAKQDAHLGFPAAADTFSCSLGIPISESDTPALYLLIRRTLADLGLATYSAKNAYQRKRPFMVNGAPICTPDEEEMLRHDGSYPSGHTAIGWGWALILSELAPERAESLLARGRAFGESRNVCNVHWRSDIIAGRMVAAAAVARLQTNEEFRTAMAEAREDVERARQKDLPPNRDCTAEARALETGF